MDPLNVTVFASGRLSRRVDIGVLEGYACFETVLRPRCAVARFDEGSIRVNASGSVSVSAVSVEDAEGILGWAEDVLSRILGPTEVVSWEVSNVSAVSSLGRRVDLMAVHAGLPRGMSDYDPEYHPALVVRMGDGLVASIYSNGSVSVTGGRSVDELRSGLDRLEGFVSSL